MAFYRTINVNDMEYEYHIGKHFVKIKGLAKVNNINKSDFFNDERGNDREVVVRVHITPGMIADYINGKKVRHNMIKKATPQCNCNKPLSEKHWRCDPFDAEIHDVYRYAMWCDECYIEREMDI